MKPFSIVGSLIPYRAERSNVGIVICYQSTFIKAGFDIFLLVQIYFVNANDQRWRFYGIEMIFVPRERAFLKHHAIW